MTVQFHAYRGDTSPILIYRRSRRERVRDAATRAAELIPPGVRESLLCLSDTGARHALIVGCTLCPSSSHSHCRSVPIAASVLHAERTRFDRRIHVPVIIKKSERLSAIIIIDELSSVVWKVSIFLNRYEKPARKIGMKIGMKIGTLNRYTCTSINYISTKVR